MTKLFNLFFGNAFSVLIACLILTVIGAVVFMIMTIVINKKAENITVLQIEPFAGEDEAVAQVTIADVKNKLHFYNIKHNAVYKTNGKVENVIIGAILITALDIYCNKYFGMDFNLYNQVQHDRVEKEIAEMNAAISEREKRAEEELETYQDELYKKNLDNMLKENNMKPKAEPAKLLPNGWKWIQYDDGSGSLTNGSNSYFSYDLSTMEYWDLNNKVQFFKDYPYRTPDSFDKFKEFAEKQILSLNYCA